MPAPKLAARASHGVYNVFANDALYGLRHVQTEVELVRQLQAGRPYPEVMEGFAKLKAQLDAKSHSVTRYFYLISLICIPDYGKAVPRVALAETKRRLALTAIALRRYELTATKSELTTDYRITRILFYP